MKNKSFHFILNPISGALNDTDLINKKINEVFSCQKDIQYKIIFTEFAGHAKEIAKRCSEENIDCVVAIGGDGTVNEVASALVGTKTALGIIPIGSGNGFARNLHIPLDLDSAINSLLSSSKKQVDTGTMNNHFFLGLTGVGFDAHISKCFSMLSKRGKWPYFKYSIKEFFHYKPDNYIINIDNREIETKSFLITVANSVEYGNAAIIAPKADSTDGSLDIIIIKQFPKIYTPILIVRLFTGTIHKSHYTIYEKGEKIRVESKESSLSHVDGDPISTNGVMNISINPMSLYVLY